MPFDAAADPKEVPSVYKAEGRRLMGMSSGGESALRLKAEAAHARLLEKKDAQAEMDFEEANLELEIFDLLHDPSGALKRETSGRDLAEQIDARWLKNVNEKPLLHTPDRVTPMFIVNMSELDRLNKKSQDYGSEALAVTADLLTEKLLASVKDEASLAGIAPESLFKIYRDDSNSFFIRFERDIPKPLAESLRSTLSLEAGARWSPEGKEDYFADAGVESPPLIADYVSLEEAMNGVPKDVRGTERANTYAVSVLKDTLYALMDARKVVSRAERMRDVIDHRDEKTARNLYDKFLKKSLAGVFSQETGPDGKPVKIETFEQFRGYLDSQKSAGIGENQLWEQAFNKALGDLQIRYEGDKAYAEKIHAFVGEKVKKERGVKPASTDVAPFVKAPDFGEGEFIAPSREDATEGLRIFAKLKADAEQEHANPQQKRIAEKRLARERAKRDTATGLELRGPLFKRMESALAEGTKRVAMVSIDMGFLKYFDQMGGKETGDLAILTVGASLQKVKDSFEGSGLEISTHRLGGDEFGMTVTAEASMTKQDFEAKLDEIRSRLADVTDRAGKIPARMGAKLGYYPTKLEVGMGIHFYENAAAADKEAARYGIAQKLPEGLEAGSEAALVWKRNQQADHLVKVADKVFGFQKSTNRFMVLLELAKDPATNEDQIKQLLAFSDKAIFGQAGRDAFATWRKRVAAGEAPEDLDTEIHAFVWDHMESAFQEELAEKGERLSHVEFAVRIEYLNGRIRELSQALQKTDRVTQAQKERYEHEQAALQEKLKAAQGDLESVRSARAAISG